MHSIFASVVENHQLAPDTYQLTLKIISDPNANNQFRFVAGQYIWLVLPDMQEEDPRGNRRAFSIASSERKVAVSQEIQLLYRSSQSGYKKTLLQLQAGNQVEFWGPFGSSLEVDFAKLHEQAVTDIYYVAGGVGIAPFLSIFRSQLDEAMQHVGADQPNESSQPAQLNQPVPTCKQHLMWHNVEASRIFLLEEIQTITQQLGVAFDQQMGSIHECKLAEGVDSAHAIFYVVGSRTFIQEIFEELKKRGVQPSQMHFEQFYPTTHHRIEFFRKKGWALPADLSHSDPFKMLADETSTHLVVTDADGLVLYANQAAQNITGFNFAEMEGGTPRLWGGLMDADQYRELWHTILEKKEPYVGSVLNRRKNGEEYVALARITPIIEGEVVVGFVASEEDISERVQLEKTLRASEEKYRNLVEEVGHSYFFYSHDTAGNLNYLSSTVKNILGYDSSELLGPLVNLPLTAHPLNAEIEKFTQLAYQGQVSPPYQIEIFHKDGRMIFIEITETPIFDDDGKVKSVEGIAKDITQEKQVDLMKTEFISLASHQLRTPLSTVSWYLEMLLAGDAGELSEEQNKFVQEAYQGSRNMNSLVNALLNVARIEAGSFVVEPEPVDVRSLMDSVVYQLKVLIDKKQLQVSIESDELPKIPLDQEITEIIFHNLLTNAIKYTPAEGEIKIGLRRYDVGAVLPNGVVAERDCMVASVTDSGMGIPEHQQANVFTKLFRANNVVKADLQGTGLGLYICKAIINQAQGQIWFTSQENQGATFYILLPITGMVEKVGTKKLSKVEIMKS